MNKPILSNRAFINVDMDDIDYEKDMFNICERVLYKGSLDDFKELRRYYGDDRIRKEIINTKCFGPKEVHFCCYIFNLKQTDFKYYKEGAFRAFPEFKDCPEDLVYLDFA